MIPVGAIVRRRGEKQSMGVVIGNSEDMFLAVPHVTVRPFDFDPRYVRVLPTEDVEIVAEEWGGASAGGNKKKHHRRSQ